MKKKGNWELKELLVIQEKLPKAGDCFDLQREYHFSEKPSCAELDKGWGLYVWTSRKSHSRANEGHHTQTRIFREQSTLSCHWQGWQLFRSKSQSSPDNSFNVQSPYLFNPEVVESFTFQQNCTLSLNSGKVIYYYLAQLRYFLKLSPSLAVDHKDLGACVALL